MTHAAKQRVPADATLPGVQIDWQGSPSTPVAAAKTPAGSGWQDRFVNHLGASAQRLNPNAGLRVSVALAPELTSLRSGR